MPTINGYSRPGGSWDYDVTLTDGRRVVLHSETEQSDPVAWAETWEIGNAIRELKEVVEADQ
jgi:hypothetical protein